MWEHIDGTPFDRLMEENKGKEDEYLELICKKNDTPERYVQIWLSLVTASHFPRVKPEEKELLMNWANVSE